MATFQLTDGFGLTASVTPNTGALAKYFKNLPDWKLSAINLEQIKDLDLTAPAVKNGQGGLTFSQPIEIGNPTVELTVGASAKGSLGIFVPASDGASLFSPDVFGDNIKVAATQRYVSANLCAELNGSASVSPGDLKFGFNGKSDVNLWYYERFGAGAKVLEAIKGTISRFCIPADLDDIAAMPEGGIAIAEGLGDLKFSGSVNLLAVTNPLATATVPLAGAITVTNGAAITVGADYEFSGKYQVRIQRLAGRTFRLGFYKERNSQFDFTVTADAALTVELGSSDLFVTLIKAISRDPTGDLKQLEAAGLSADQSKAIQSAIKSAVNRCLQIGASLELLRADESAAMFLYEVNLDALGADGRTVLHSALEGNLSALVKTDTNPPAGITVVKTLISKGRTFQHSLKLNLLGIYNVLQLSKLLIEGSKAWDPRTGEVVLTDRIAADKIGVLTSNLEIKDSDKLRRILAEHFLITSAYRAVAGVVGSPELAGLQSYFNLEQNPSASRMRDYLGLPVALGLETLVAAQASLPKGVDDFGHTTVYAEAGYDHPAFRSLFFSGTGLQDPAVYTAAGRQAIQSLVTAGDPDDGRLLLATNDPFFRELQRIGNVQSAEFAEACVKAGVPAAIVPAVGTDYTDIVWFAGAMQNAGQKLQAIDAYFASHPQTDPQNHDFLQLKKQLADALGKAAERATADFGGPWGFLAMARLGKASSKKWLLVNRYITSELAAGQAPAMRAAGAS